MESKYKKRFEVIVALWTLIFISLSFISLAVPQGITEIINIENRTESASAGLEINTSGGTISLINITGVSQNLRWKAYVGNVTGKLTLDDSTGSTIYDWTMSSLTGEIYATRTSNIPSWSTIKCANTTILENENLLLNHTSSDDNITKTFEGVTHNSFYVGSILIPNNECPTTNTYVNSAAQDQNFEEIVLYDGPNETIESGNVIYASIINASTTGYNNEIYDFQMILPEVGLTSWESSTAYYFYAELV